MSIIEKAAAKAGMRLEADTLPPDQRTVKCFRRLISEMRQCEAIIQDTLNSAERELNEALQRNLEAQERIHQLEGELLKVRMKTHLDGIEALTVNDKTRLLELSGNGVS